MDLSDDDVAAVEFFKRNAISTSKGGMEINVSATVLQLAQKLSDARAALRGAREDIGAIYAHIDSDRGSKAMKRCGEAARLIDRALAATPAPVAVPATKRKFTGGGTRNCVPAPVAAPTARKEANGVTNFTDTQKAERQAALASMKPTRVGDFTPAPVAVPVCSNCGRERATKIENPPRFDVCYREHSYRDDDAWRDCHNFKDKVGAYAVPPAPAPAPVQVAYADCTRIVRELCGDKEPAVGFGELLVSAIEAAARHAVTVRPGALYAAVFPAVPAILRLFIESACPLDAEMARVVLAAVEACK